MDQKLATGFGLRITSLQHVDKDPETHYGLHMVLLMIFYQMLLLNRIAKDRRDIHVLI